MAETIHLDVVTTAHSRGLKDAERDLRGLRSEADKTGKSFHETGRESFSLDRAIEDARIEVHRLNEEFKRTGDMNLVRHMRRQRSELNEFIRAAGAAGGAAGNLAGGGVDFGGAGMRPRNMLIAGVAGALVLLSPMIGAAIAGAVTGAVGTGGIIGGIASAAKDPRVKTAARQFGDTISTAFFGGEGAGAFVQPVIDSLDLLGKEFVDLNLGKTFARAAPYVTDLAKGVAGFAREFGGSFDRVMSRSSEIIPAIAQGLVRLGDGLGSMIEEMAASEGTIQGIRFLFEAVAETAHALGVTVKFLGDSFAYLGRFSGNLSGALEDVAAALPGVGDDNAFSRINDHIEAVTGNGGDLVRVLHQLPPGAGRAAEGLVPLAASATEVSDAMEKMNDEIERSIDAALAADSANLAYREGLLELKKSVDEHGTSLDRSTQEGIDNRQMIDGLIGDLRRERDAAITAAKGNEDLEKRARAAYSRQLKALEAKLVKMGFERSVIDQIIARYRALAAMPNIVKSVTIREVRDGELIAKNSAGQRPPGRAAGGPVWPGDWIVGEERPERLRINADGTGYVYPTVGSGGRRSGGSGGGGYARSLLIQATDPLMQLLLNALVREIGNRGGTLAAIGIR